MSAWAGAVSKNQGITALLRLRKRSDRRCAGIARGPGEPPTRLEGGRLGRRPREATPERAVKRAQELGVVTGRDRQS